MRIFAAENLKYKRSFSRKLIIVAPLLSVFVSIMFGGLLNVQSQLIYWWYSFLLPGTVALLGVLSEKKEERINYYNVLTLPTNVAHLCYARIAVIASYLALMGVVLVLPMTSVKYWAPIASQITNGKLIIGMFLISIMSFWQIPFSLFVAKKTGILFPILLNSIAGLILMPLAGFKFWMIIPYCWIPRVIQNYLGVSVNGTFLGDQLKCNSSECAIGIILSIGLLLILSKMVVINYRREAV